MSKHYNHDIKSSEKFALASFQDMKKNLVSYNPVNFSVWYNFHAKTNPQLVSRIDAMLSSQGRIAEEDSAGLFDEFVAGEILTKSRQISEKLSHIVEEITGNLDNSSKKSGDYVGKMETLQEDLSSARSVDVADDVVNKILSASRSVTAEIQVLRESSRLHQEQMNALRQELETIRDESRTDQLTGIANRRQFNESLQQLCDGPSRHNEPFSLVLGDIDFFKQFNDQFGHQAGDEVLSLVGGLLRQNVKAKDLAARYGGEEFALLLPNTTLSSAIQFADMLRKMVSEDKIVWDGHETKITMSLGVAQFDCQETPESLIARADENLFLSKQSGRNMVSPTPEQVKEHEVEFIDIDQMR